MDALAGASVIVRAGLDDDAMLRAAVRLGIPVVAVRSREDAVDVIAFPRHGPCPHAALDIASQKATQAPTEGTSALLAGTLAATEALWMLADPARLPRARHLRMPLDGGAPTAQDIPWTPECFLCGGAATEAQF